MAQGVDPAERGKGHATRPMDEAEVYARKRKCHSVNLDTHSFQARPFYGERGCEVFGTLGGFLNEHKKFYLRKRL